MEVLKNDLENNGNYLYLLVQNYFHINPIFKVFGALKKSEQSVPSEIF